MDEPIYLELGKLQADLNATVRKAENLRLITQDVSYQATLKRISSNFNCIFSSHKQKAYFPHPVQQESYERKFSLLRRSTYLLLEELKESRKYIQDLHDATRAYDKQMKLEVPIKKQEKLVKQERQQLNQIIEIDDEVEIIPNQTKFKNIKILNSSEEDVDFLSLNQVQVCCSCNLGNHRSFDSQLLYAYYCIRKFQHQDHLYTSICQFKWPDQFKYMELEQCLSLQFVRIYQKVTEEIRQFMLQNIKQKELTNFKDIIERFKKIRFAQPNLSQLKYHLGDFLIDKLMNLDNIWVWAFYRLVKEIFELMNPFLSQIFKPLRKAIFVNLICKEPESQIFNDIIESIVNLQNGQIIFDSQDTVHLTEDLQTANIVLVNSHYYQQFINTCESKYSFSKIPRLFLIISSQKIKVSKDYQLRQVEIPQQKLIDLELEYHYNFLKYYFNLMIFNDNSQNQMNISFFILFWMMYMKIQQLIPSKQFNDLEKLYTDQVRSINMQKDIRLKILDTTNKSFKIKPVKLESHIVRSSLENVRLLLNQP